MTEGPDRPWFGGTRLRGYCECIGVRRCVETMNQAQVVDAFRDLRLEESGHVYMIMHRTKIGALNRSDAYPEPCTQQARD